MLLGVARNVQPELCEYVPGVTPIDLRLEQLRGLLLGREIEELARLRDTVEDPEQLAAAVARILPTAFAAASSEARLGQVMAPILERATQSSIRNDPRTLINILYPMIVPAIRKSITETIDQTFQSINKSLKHSLTWRGLKWRWEAWRTGASFAEVVLRHTLVYQVEHVFLIHRHTGLLISHVAAENAASQDPQLVSSMLTAIQDFVRESFSGAEHQGLDTLRLGELTLWSEPGPFATLVAVIRGNPPEELHGILTNELSRIRGAPYRAGDVRRRQRRPRRHRCPTGRMRDPATTGAAGRAAQRPPADRADHAGAAAAHRRLGRSPLAGGSALGRLRDTAPRAAWYRAY